MSIANLMMWIGIGLPLSLLAAFFVYPFEADGPERGIVAIWAFSITYIAVLIWGARLSLGVLLTEPSPPSFATKPVWTGRDDDQ
ncbi:MAG: hypothetical protein HKN47_29225 [Pirellulaceae bacterium]|nr:hypothetical protein [Pirellulaceae bacterium]